MKIDLSPLPRKALSLLELAEGCDTPVGVVVRLLQYLSVRGREASEDGDPIEVLIADRNGSFILQVREDV